MPATIDSTHLLRLRLSSQHIEPRSDAGPSRAAQRGAAQSGSAPPSPAPSVGHSNAASVVQHLLAMQAQDFAQALWAVGVRAPGCTRDDVGMALERGDVVRSWPMRGTLHFVAATDLRWMLRLTAPRTIASAATRQRQLELDNSTLMRARDVTLAALSGGKRLGRAELLATLGHAGIATTGQRGYHIIWYLAQNGLVCWGPPLGTQQALVLLDEWVPASHDLERDESLREFALRYFSGHGPATLRDFVWWSKLTVAEAKVGLALARPELTEVLYDETSYWMSAREADAASVPRPTPRVHTLPGFDEYLLGYQDRSHALAADKAARIVPGNNGVFLPMMVSGGRIIGTWRRAVSTIGVTVTAQPFEELTTRETAAFSREATAYGTFLGLPTRVDFLP